MSPETVRAELDRRKAVSHPELYHVTRSKTAIQAEGFHGKRRSSLEGGAGAYFGGGTYFHTDKKHSDEYLAGERSFGYGDEEQIPVSAHVESPFEVQVRPNEQGELQPGRIMQRALVEAGLAKPGEKLTPAEVTRRLQGKGHDAVRVRQPKYSSEIAGDQLVVFDASKAKYGHAKKSVGPSGTSTRPLSSSQLKTADQAKYVESQLATARAQHAADIKRGDRSESFLKSGEIGIARLERRLDELGGRKNAPKAPSYRDDPAGFVWGKLGKLSAKHGGRITSQDATTTRVEFPMYTRSAGFYDQVFGTEGLDVDFAGKNDTTVIIRRKR